MYVQIRSTDASLNVQIAQLIVKAIMAMREFISQRVTGIKKIVFTLLQPSKPKFKSRLMKVQRRLRLVHQQVLSFVTKLAR